MTSHNNNGRWRCAAIAVGLCGSLSGCAVLTPAPDLTSDQQKTLTSDLKARYAAYQNCMVTEADRFSHIASVPPSDIARGAQAGCEAAYRKYQQAVTKQFTAVVSGSGQQEAQRRAGHHAEEAAYRTRSQIIRRVLIQRQ